MSATGPRAIAVLSNDPLVLSDVDVVAHSAFSYAVWVTNGAILLHSSIRSESTYTSNQLFNNAGIFMPSGTGEIVLRDSQIEVTGAAGDVYAILLFGGAGSTFLENAKVVATSTNPTAYAFGGGPLRAVASQLGGAINSSDAKCVGAYKADYAALTPTCG